MPEGPDGKTIIIVKKVSGHGGHHGGAWKVAYADFVTAMMALFMVLWLVNSASITTRERIASYFREPGVFEKGSGTPLEEGGAGILNDAFSPPADENSRAASGKKIYKIEASQGKLPDAFDAAESSGNGKGEFTVQQKSELDEIADQIKKQIAAAAASIGENAKLLGKIEIKVDQRGLHIEIMDTETASMFELGSSRINPVAEEELSKIAKILTKLPNPIDIEGHTDGKPFTSKSREQYDNWNLSTDRANAARRVLNRSGILDKQIARVVGYADQRLKFTDDPLKAANRRISISMRFTELAHKALEGTQTKVTESKKVSPVNPKVAPTPEPTPTPQKEPNLTEPAKVTTPLTEQQQKDQATQAAAEKEKAEHEKTLAVEVNTSQPEGNPLQGDEGDSSWSEKDKIFGSKNPFFPK